MKAASRWRAVRTSLPIMPGTSSMVAKASWPPTQPDSGSVATTVAVRGASRSRAISPTISGGENSRTVGTPSLPLCVTSARPEPISKNDSARSPWRIKTRPAAAFSGRSCAASGTRASGRQPSKTSRAASSSALTAVSPATSRGYAPAGARIADAMVMAPFGARSAWPRIVRAAPRCPWRPNVCVRPHRRARWLPTSTGSVDPMSSRDRRAGQPR